MTPSLYLVYLMTLLSVVGVVEAVETLPGVSAVLRRVHCHHHCDLVVDVICCQGQTWVKVVARNSKALMKDLNGKFLVP